MSELLISPSNGIAFYLISQRTDRFHLFNASPSGFRITGFRTSQLSKGYCQKNLFFLYSFRMYLSALLFSIWKLSWRIYIFQCIGRRFYHCSCMDMPISLFEYNFKQCSERTRKDQYYFLQWHPRTFHPHWIHLSGSSKNRNPWLSVRTSCKSAIYHQLRLPLSSQYAPKSANRFSRLISNSNYIIMIST